jgi:hypothetical protein
MNRAFNLGQAIQLLVDDHRSAQEIGAGQVALNACAIDFPNELALGGQIVGAEPIGNRIAA